MRGVLGRAVELYTFGSPGGLQIPHFGSVGLHPHTWPKWGCDTNDVLPRVLILNYLKYNNYYYLKII
jgi:hypothetical protein